jgi:hypothetical protein
VLFRKAVIRDQFRKGEVANDLTKEMTEFSEDFQQHRQITSPHTNLRCNSFNVGVSVAIKNGSELF